MDATETAALRKLGERELWGVDELPAAIDLDMLRCLDTLELIEARYVVMWHQTEPPTPSPSEWLSPIRKPEMCGPWMQVVSKRLRDRSNHPCEVRVSEQGRATLARLARASRDQVGGLSSERPIVNMREFESVGHAVGEVIRLLQQAEAAASGKVAYMSADPATVVGDASFAHLFRLFQGVAGPFVQVAYALRIDGSALDDLLRTGDLALVPGALHVLRQIQGEDLNRRTIRREGSVKGNQKVSEASSRASKQEQKWLTVTEASETSGLPTYAISRLANARRLKTNGKRGRARRIDAISLVKLKLAIRKDETLKALRKFVK